jgi:C4-type Zn-finger protein
MRRCSKCGSLMDSYIDYKYGIAYTTYFCNCCGSNSNDTATYTTNKTEPNDYKITFTDRITSFLWR